MARSLLTRLATAYLLLFFYDWEIRAFVLEKSAEESLRIVGGSKTSIAEFPFQLSIRNRSEHYCGGAVLDSNWAITAAHCVEEDRPECYSLRMGSTYYDEGGEIVRIAVIHLLPPHDVALLYVGGDQLRGDFVRPINLPASESLLLPGTAVNISGWGDVEPSRTFSPSLLYATVNMVDQEECARQYSEYDVDDTMFCAAAADKDSCNADSGGPIQVNNTLYGIVIGGEGCARPEYAGVYLRVDYPEIRNWIYEIAGL